MELRPTASASRPPIAAPPLVSVVMAVKDGARFLPAALDSILGQSLHQLELIVLDDASRDATPELLRAAAARDARVRVLPVAGRGFAPALNQGFREARGRYLARMDADDVSLPERLERQVALLERRDRIAVVGGAIELIGEDGRPLARVRFPAGSARIQDTLPVRNCLAHSTVVMRRHAFFESGGFRQSLHPAEDYDLWLRISERWPLANLAEVVLRYRLHPRQASLADLERLARCALAARIAARHRACGLPEPFDGSAPVTAADLLRAGVAERQLAAETVHHALTWVELLGLSPAFSDRDLAALFARTLARAEGYGHRQARARFHWTMAKRRLREGRPAAAFAELTRSLRLAPRLVPERVASHLATRLAFRGGALAEGHSAEEGRYPSVGAARPADTAARIVS